MGCTFSNVVNTKKEEARKNGYQISIVTPNNDNNLEFIVPALGKNELIMDVMNRICFGKETEIKLDGNFICLYDKDEDKFHYYAQRLNGISIDDWNNPNKGKMWVCYLNDVKENWDFMVENNQKISPKDVVKWKFEEFEEGSKKDLSSRVTKKDTQEK